MRGGECQGPGGGGNGFRVSGGRAGFRPDENRSWHPSEQHLVCPRLSDASRRRVACSPPALGFPWADYVGPGGKPALTLVLTFMLVLRGVGGRRGRGHATEAPPGTNVWSDGRVSRGRGCWSADSGRRQRRSARRVGLRVEAGLDAGLDLHARSPWGWRPAGERSRDRGPARHERLGWRCGTPRPWPLGRRLGTPPPPVSQGR